MMVGRIFAYLVVELIKSSTKRIQEQLESNYDCLQESLAAKGA